jgi:hypothetical protein
LGKGDPELNGSIDAYPAVNAGNLIKGCPLEGPATGLFLGEMKMYAPNRALAQAEA